MSASVQSIICSPTAKLFRSPSNWRIGRSELTELKILDNFFTGTALTVVLMQYFSNLCSSHGVLQLAVNACVLATILYLLY